MANVSAPNGFMTDGTIGSAPNAELVERQVAYDNATKIFMGDPVLNLATGYIGQWVNGTANYLMAGIFNGCRYLSLSQGKVVYSQYWPGADAAANSVFASLIPVYPGVPQKFIVQANAGPITLADIGQNADVTVGTGSTITGLSGATLSNLGTTATLPFTIIGLYAGVGNGSDVATAYNKVIVASNVGGQTGI